MRLRAPEFGIPPAWPRASYAWYVVAMLVLAYSFGILDRAVIGLLVQPIKADLGVTDSQIGLLQGLAFAICYTTFGLAFGLVTDWTNRRWLMTVAVLVWSASTIACGFAGGFAMLFLARIGVGLGEACTTGRSRSSSRGCRAWSWHCCSC